MAPLTSPSPAPHRRYLSLFLPYLSTDLIFRKRLGRTWRSAALHKPEGRQASLTDPAQENPAPLAVIAKLKSALRLLALDETARRLGLRTGMALADARAMIPGLEAIDADTAADAALLTAVADWAERYTPLVALDPPDGLSLDITGAAHLFGGEEALLADLETRLAGQGFLARGAIADTPGAAFAAVRHGDGGVVSSGGTVALLKPLPIAALRLAPEIVAALDRVGLKRIGQLIDAPRAPLTDRFGRTLLRRLDQALGREEEAINPRRPVAALTAERRFAEPIAREEDIAATLASLAEALVGTLESTGEGARTLELSLFRVDGAVRRIAVGTSRPVRMPRLVLDLFREKFSGLVEEIDAGFGFDMLRLSVLAAAPFDIVQVDLSGAAIAEADLAILVDRIGARLGPDRVSRLEMTDSHIPEQACRLAEMDTFETSDSRLLPLATARPPHGSDGSSPEIDRPLRLFAAPEPVEAIAEVPDGPPTRFRWRRTLYRIARAEGPERIATEWWQDSTRQLTRDYFRVEDFAGRRFWLFREGLFERETVFPRWYLHGVFA